MMYLMTMRTYLCLIPLFGTCVQSFIHPVYRGVIPSSEFPQGIRPEGCVSSCEGMADGDYPSCDGCLFFTTCSNGHASPARPCPWFGGLFWNEREGRCDWHPAFCFRWSDDDHVFKPSCVSSCEDMPDGDYQSCASCDVYVSCVGGFIWGNRICVPGLVWDDKLKTCEWRSRTCKIRKHIQKKIALQHMELDDAIQEHRRRPVYKPVHHPPPPPIFPKQLPLKTVLPFSSPLIHRSAFYRSNIRETEAEPARAERLRGRMLPLTYVRPPSTSVKRLSTAGNKKRSKQLPTTNAAYVTNATHVPVQKPHWTDIYRKKHETRPSKKLDRRRYVFGQQHSNRKQFDIKTVPIRALQIKQRQVRTKFPSGPTKHFKEVSTNRGVNRQPYRYSNPKVSRKYNVTPRTNRDRIALLLARGPV